MCAKCNRLIVLPSDSHLCQTCLDQHDLKEMEGSMEILKREVDCLVEQIANLGILRAQYKRDQPYSELAESTNEQLLGMKRSERLFRDKLSDLQEQELATKKRMNSKTAIKETSTSTSELPNTTLPQIGSKKAGKIGLANKRRL